ncbi:hypothetical protein LJR066_004077 [Acidovorax sp. LjRoot66]|uniref:ankyrin repeat domain-containing protein n=1 Tax=Acidovorax sp. LjRoot66 TaxID=3342334 RepID=UPI003ECF7034
MSARDDELTQRYREASEQEDARPGAHVRAAVRAHAQMLAAAPLPTAPAAPSPVAANQSHWKITALATVAVVGLTGLLLLQFQRGTPEEQEIAYGQRRAEAPARAQPSAAAPPAPAPAAEAPLAAPAAPPVPQSRARDEASPSAGSAAQKPAAPALGQAAPLAKTVPAPAMREAESPTAAGAAGAVSGFPASPPLTADRSSVSGSAPPVAPSTPSTPRGEMRERLAVQDAPAAAAAETSRSAAPVQALPAPTAVPRRQDSSAAGNSLAAAAPRADSGGSASLPDDLREAARTGHALQVESLIRQGAPIDARDNAGKTALMLAAMGGQTTTVQKLLALGANPALVDREGLGAAQHARRLGYTRIAELIEATP